MFEPGRSIVGSAGVLAHARRISEAGRVEELRNRRRRDERPDPARDVRRVDGRACRSCRDGGDTKRYDIVGPVCESGDWLARDRDLAFSPGDLLAIAERRRLRNGDELATTTVERRPAEVMVDGAAAYCVRRRETVEELFAMESRVL